MDKSNHTNVIVKAMRTSTNEIICFERFSDQIKFYDTELNYVKKEKIPLKSPGFITSITYDEKNKIYGASSTDGYLHFYQMGKLRLEFLKSIECPCIQQRIWYLPE